MKKYLISGFNTVQDVKLEVGTYTLVAYVKSMHGDVYTFALWDGTDWEEFSIDVIQGQLCKVWLTFTIDKKATKFKPIANNFTEELPVYVADLQLTRGNIPVESGASPFDIDQILNDLHDEINAIEDFTEGAFKDGLLNDVEKMQLKVSLDAVGAIVESVKGSYDKLKVNPFISQDRMADINRTYNDFMVAWINSNFDPKNPYDVTNKGGLKDIILWIVYGDEIVDENERAEKDRALEAFNSALYAYNLAEKEVYKDIGDEIEDVQAEIDKAQAIPYQAGEYKAGTPYARYPNSYPIVSYGTSGGVPLYYALKGDVGTNKQPNLPANKDIWESVPSFKQVFTEVLFANFAKLDSFVFNGGKMFSQEGTLNGIAGSVEYTDEDHEPNFEVEGFSGKVKMKNAEIEGKITATSGKIGNWNIVGGGLYSDYSTIASIKIEQSGGKFLRINEYTTSPMLAIRADNSTALSIYTQGGVGGVGISIAAQTGATAIQSFGSHSFVQRNTEKWNAPGVLMIAQRILNSLSGTSNVYKQKWMIEPLKNTYIYRSGRTIELRHNIGHTDYVAYILINAGTAAVDSVSHTSEKSTFTISGNYAETHEITIVMIGRNKI